MTGIAEARARLSSARQPEETLTAALDAFACALAVCQAHQDPADPRFTPFVMAAIHAAEGRDAIAFAPSLPAGEPPEAAGRGPDTAGVSDSRRAANDIAGLSALLRDQLTGLAQAVHLPGDYRACIDGARSAQAIHQLLASSAGS